MRPHAAHRARVPGGFKSHDHASDPARAGALRPDLVFVITFREIASWTKKWARKTPPAILYNLREKSGPKLKNIRSYSNSTAKFPLSSDPPLYSCSIDLQLYTTAVYGRTKFSSSTELEYGCTQVPCVPVLNSVNYAITVYLLISHL